MLCVVVTWLNLSFDRAQAMSSLHSAFIDAEWGLANQLCEEKPVKVEQCRCKIQCRRPPAFPIALRKLHACMLNFPELCDNHTMLQMPQSHITRPDQQTIPALQTTAVLSVLMTQQTRLQNQTTHNHKTIGNSS